MGEVVVFIVKMLKDFIALKFISTFSDTLWSLRYKLSLRFHQTPGSKVRLFKTKVDSVWLYGWDSILSIKGHL